MSSIPLSDFTGMHIEEDPKIRFQPQYSNINTKIYCAKYRPLQIGLPDNTISHEFYLSRDIERVLTYCTEHDDIWTSINAVTDFRFKQHLNLFLTKLSLWDSIPIEKPISSEDVFLRCLIDGPVFADEIKDIRFYSFKKTVDIIEQDVGEESYTVEGYDSIFRETDLIHWTESSNDLPWGAIPSKPLQKGKELFETYLRDHVSKNQDRLRSDISKFEVLITINNASSVRQGDTVYQVLNESDKNREIIPGMMGRRSIIQVKPGSCRDSVIADSHTLIKLKANNIALMSLLDTYACSAMCSSNLIKKRLKLLKRPGLHFSLDIKKCGISFPKWILLSIGKILSEFGINNFMSDFELAHVLLQEGDYVTLPRGYNLGWCNEAPTIVWCVLLDVLRNHFDFKNLYGLFFNDDSDFSTGSNKIVDIQYMMAVARMVLTSWDLLLNDKKNIVSECSLFCEIYTNTEIYEYDHRKRQAATSAMGQALCVKHVSLKREYMSDIYPYLDSSIEHILNGVLEALAEQSKMPINFAYLSTYHGGFCNTMSNSLMTHLMPLDQPDTGQIRRILVFDRLTQSLPKPKILDFRKPKKTADPPLIREIPMIVPPDILEKAKDIRMNAYIRMKTFIAKANEEGTEFGNIRNANSYTIVQEYMDDLLSSMGVDPILGLEYKVP